MIDLFQTDEFTRWLKRLRDINVRARINVRLKRIALTGNLGDAKPASNGIYEFCIDYGPGYRVYYSQRGREMLLLLIGGDKSSQQKDIEKVKKVNAEYE